jgi:hypothetical protein
MTTRSLTHDNSGRPVGDTGLTGEGFFYYRFFLAHFSSVAVPIAMMRTTTLALAGYRRRRRERKGHESCLSIHSKWHDGFGGFLLDCHAKNLPLLSHAGCSFRYLRLKMTRQSLGRKRDRASSLLCGMIIIIILEHGRSAPWHLVSDFDGFRNI